MSNLLFVILGVCLLQVFSGTCTKGNGGWGTTLEESVLDGPECQPQTACLMDCSAYIPNCPSGVKKYFDLTAMKNAPQYNDGRNNWNWFEYYYSCVKREETERFLERDKGTVEDRSTIAQMDDLEKAFLKIADDNKIKTMVAHGKVIFYYPGDPESEGYALRSTYQTMLFHFKDKLRELALDCEKNPNWKTDIQSRLDKVRSDWENGFEKIAQYFRDKVPADIKALYNTWKTILIETAKKQVLSGKPISLCNCAHFPDANKWIMFLLTDPIYGPVNSKPNQVPNNQQYLSDYQNRLKLIKDTCTKACDAARPVVAPPQTPLPPKDQAPTTGSGSGSGSINVPPKPTVGTPNVFVPPKPVVLVPPKPQVVLPPKPVVFVPPKPFVLTPPKPVVLTPKPHVVLPKPVVFAPPKPVVFTPPKPQVIVPPKPVFAAPKPVVFAAPKPQVVLPPKPVPIVLRKGGFRRVLEEETETLETEILEEDELDLKEL